MERAAWTDERLDDLAEAMRTGFARMDQDIRDLRSEMHDGFSGLRSELHTEVAGLRSELHTEVDSLRLAIMRIGGGIIIALIGVIAAILARGV
jgi:hypothetical protein